MFLRSFLLFSFILQSFTATALPTEGTKILISAISPYAVEAGKEIHQKGGNIVDVAVATALTLAVTTPYFASFGGGGFALVKNESRPVDVLDFREMAPSATSEKFYKGLPIQASRTGGKAVGVPGVPAGLWALHQKYGKLKWKELFKTPLRLAKEGFQVTGEWAKNTARQDKRFTKASKKHFFKNKTTYSPGENFKQKSLFKALKKMRKTGIKDFYNGDIAKDIVKSVQEADGPLTLGDMKNYKVRWMKPLTTEFKNHKIFTMPPPSSGGVILSSALKLSKLVALEKQETLSVNELHLISEILSRSYRGRSLLGDPDFNQNPVADLLSDKYLKKISKTISLNKTRKLSPLKSTKFQKQSPQTTHISVLDKDGNAVSMTITLNGYYGSGVTSAKYGIVLNNEMDDFTTHPSTPNMFGLIQGKANSVQPGKRPLSSMTPTLVEKDGKIVMSIGAPGGPRIISAVFQAIYRNLVSDLDMDRSIQAPRVHHQFLPHTLFIDRGARFTPETIKGLKAKGHKVKESWSARVYGVKLNKKGNLEAAFDNRGDGAAGGY